MQFIREKPTALSHHRNINGEQQSTANPFKTLFFKGINADTGKLK
jgi:hypothetical protein